MTAKDIAALRREKAELEQARIQGKRDFEMRKEDMTEAEINAAAEQMRSNNDRIDEIIQQLQAAGNTQNKGGVDFMQGLQQEMVTKDNFRQSTQYRDAFYRSFINGRVSEGDAEVLQFGKMAITTGNGDGVASGGEYLTPTTTVNKIHSVVEQYGKVYAKVSKFTFDGDVSLPIGTANTPTNNADGTDSLTFTFTEMPIYTEAVVATIVVKNLMLKKGIPALEDYLATEIGKYIGMTLEFKVLNAAANGSTFQGIIPHLKATPDARVGTYEAMTWGVVAEIMGKVNSPYGDNATWIMKRSTFFKHFFAMVDNTGRPLVTVAPSAISGGTPPRDNFGASPAYMIAGQPVIFTEQLPAADADGILYFDLSMYKVNESQSVTIESDASEKFSQDKRVWRGKVYTGGKPLLPKVAGVYYTHDPS